MLRVLRVSGHVLKNIEPACHISTGAPRSPPVPPRAPPGPLFTLSPPVKSVVTSPLAWIDVGTVYLRGIVEITDEG